MTAQQAPLPQATGTIRLAETILKVSLVGILIPACLALLPAPLMTQLNSLLFASLAAFILTLIAWVALMLRGTLHRGL